MEKCLEKQNQNKIPTILYVEDHWESIKLLNLYLRNKFNILSADSMQSAINILENNSVSLILMDISLRNNEDGIQLTKKIKADNRYRDLPVIALTAYSLRRDKENFIAAGMIDCVTKPIIVEELIYKINETLSQLAN